MDTWPSWREFGADGMKTLRAAISASGGSARWIDEFEVTVPHRYTGPRRYWTDERIREALTALCNDQAVFPSRRDMNRAGYAGRSVARRTGAAWTGGRRSSVCRGAGGAVRRGSSLLQ